MAQRIQEVFKSIAPRSVSAVPATGVEAAVSGSDLSPALAEAAGEIAKLRDVYQRQADLITANTTALNQSGSSGSSKTASVASTASGFLSSGLGLLSPIVSGLLGLFGHHSSTPAPLPVYTPPPPVTIDAVLRSNSQPSPAGESVSPSAAAVTAPWPEGASVWPSPAIAPAPWIAGASVSPSPAVAPESWLAGSSVPPSPSIAPSPAGASVSPSPTLTPAPAYSPQITVNVSAMDSQSFMDRSSDIASAVREAMLNNHPINGVISDL